MTSKKQPNTVIVTGGAGYIGSHICKLLSQKGHTPVAVDNLSLGHKASVQWGPLEELNLLDEKKLIKVLSYYQPIAIFHCAASAYVGESVKNPAKYYENNLTASLTLLKAMKKTRVENIIFSSSCATYGISKGYLKEQDTQMPINPYGRTKLFTEHLIKDFQKAYGMRYAILRYFNVAGNDPDAAIGESHTPETHLIPLMLTALLHKKKFTLLGDDYPTDDGTAIRDFVHVIDVAKANYLALQYLLKAHTSITLNIGSGKGHSVMQIIKQSEQIVQKKLDYAIKPRREGDPPVLVASIDKLKKIFSWQPENSDMTTMLHSSLTWIQKNDK